MKTRMAVTVAVLLAFIGCGVFADGMRTWTSTTGVSVEAEYIELKGTKAIFKRPDGAVMGIDISSLSEPDREIVLQKAKAAGQIPDEGTGAISRKTPAELPVYSDGRWKGHHTVYEGDSYVGTIDAEGTIRIHPRLADNKLGKAIWQRFGILYIDPKRPRNRNRVSRVLEEFVEHPDPAKLSGRKQTLVFKARFEANVETVCTVEFTSDTVTVELELEEPRDQVHPSRCRFIWRVPATISAKEYDSLEELKALTDGWNLELKPQKGSGEEYPFWKSMTSKGGLKSATVKGPWEEREIEFDFRRDNFSVFHVYSGKACVDGFSFYREFVIKNQDEIEQAITIK